MWHLPVLVAFFTALLASPLAFPANLSAIYALAQANDAQFAAAVHAAEAGREKGAQGRALLRPTISINGNMKENREASSAYNGTQMYSSDALSVSLNQPLLRPVNLAAYRQGELQAALADQQLKLAEQDLMVRVSRAYFETLQAQDALATVGAQKEAFTQQLAQAKRSFGVGLAPVTDVNEAQTRYDLTVAQEIAAGNDLEVKRRTLEKTINVPLPQLASLDPAVNIDLIAADQLKSHVENSATSATQVTIAVTGVMIAQYEIEKQSAGHYPTIDLVGNYSKNHNANFNGFSGQATEASYIGFEFSVPIYQGGAISSRVREALANLGRAQSELENSQRQATLDARQAQMGVRSGIALNQALAQAVVSGETQVRSTRRGLEVGVRTRVDVLNAEQQLYTTRRDQSAARYQALVSGLQLKFAAGVINVQDLKSLDALLHE